jgi:hypothetical protein
VVPLAELPTASVQVEAAAADLTGMPDINPPPTLLSSVPSDAVDALAGYFRLRVAGPDNTHVVEELALFVGLVDAAVICARLAARVLSCLIPQYSVAYPDGEPLVELHARLSGHLNSSRKTVRRRARQLLATALGIESELPAQLTGHGPTVADPDWIEAGALVLQLCLDYVTGCFGIDGLSPADVLAECATAA